MDLSLILRIFDLYYYYYYCDRSWRWLCLTLSALYWRDVRGAALVMWRLYNKVLELLNYDKMFFSTFSWILGFWQLCAQPAIHRPKNKNAWSYMRLLIPREAVKEYLGLAKLFLVFLFCFYLFFLFQKYFYQDWKFRVSTCSTFCINSFPRSSLLFDALRSGQNHSKKKRMTGREPGVQRVTPPPTPPNSCHGVFANRSIFSLSLPRTQTP